MKVAQPVNPSPGEFRHRQILYNMMGWTSESSSACENVSPGAQVCYNYIKNIKWESLKLSRRHLVTSYTAEHQQPAQLNWRLPHLYWKLPCLYNGAYACTEGCYACTEDCYACTEGCYTCTEGCYDCIDGCHACMMVTVPVLKAVTLVLKAVTLVMKAVMPV